MSNDDVVLVDSELKALREKREKVLHKNYDTDDGEQRLNELQTLLKDEKVKLESMRSRILAQLYKEFGSEEDEPSQPLAGIGSSTNGISDSSSQPASIVTLIGARLHVL